MTSEQEAAIYAAIHADPFALAYAVVGNDDAVCGWLNTPRVTVYRRVNSDQLSRWAVMRCIFSKLEAEVEHGTNGKREIAKAGLKLFSRDNFVLPLDAEIVEMIDRLVSGGVFEAEDKINLFSRAAEQISLAESLCGNGVTVADIGRILASDRPDGKIPAEGV